MRSRYTVEGLIVHLVWNETASVGKASEEYNNNNKKVTVFNPSNQWV